MFGWEGVVSFNESNVSSGGVFLFPYSVFGELIFCLFELSVSIYNVDSNPFSI